MQKLPVIDQSEGHKEVNEVHSSFLFKPSSQEIESQPCKHWLHLISEYVPLHLLLQFPFIFVKRFISGVDELEENTILSESNCRVKFLA